MAAYIDGTMVNCFPSTKRASVNKLLTENSITRIINKLIDNDSYVITTGLSDVDFSKNISRDEWMNAQSDFEFIIHGYYFSISKSEDDMSGFDYLIRATGFEQYCNASDHNKEAHKLYARIFIDVDDKRYPELYGQIDEEGTGKYLGIRFFIDSEDIIYPSGLDPESCEVYDAPLIDYMRINDEPKEEYTSSDFNFYVSLDSVFKFGSQSIKNIDGGEIIF